MKKKTFLNSFFEATIFLIPESGKDTTIKKKLQDNIPDKDRLKITFFKFIRFFKSKGHCQ